MLKQPEGESKGRGEKSRQGGTSGAAPKPINCQLPGADLLEQGKSVDEIIAALETKKHAGGRPTIQTQEVTDRVLAELMAGKSLVKICKADDMPCYGTVCNWLAKDKEFLNNYVKAREVQADYLADEILDIADDATNDEIMTDEGKRLCNTEFIQRSKLRVDARKWVASKILPKKYGDKITQEHTGPEGGPVEFNDIQRSARIAAILSEAKKRAGK